MVTTLLRITMAMKPSTNQGMDGAASHLVKAKIETNVASMTSTRGRPALTCDAITCCQSKMMPSRRMRFRLNVTPGLLLISCTATLVLTLPIMVPLVVSLGFDPIWFGVVKIVAEDP